MLRGPWLLLALCAVLCAGTYSAKASDDRTPIPADVLAQVQGMAIEQQCEALAATDKTLATVVLFELTRDSDMALSNWERLFAVAEALSLKLLDDCELVKAVDPASFSGRNRQATILKRVSRCIRNAQDGPARWTALDGFIGRLYGVLRSNRPTEDRVLALRTMTEVRDVSPYVDNARGTDRVLQAAEEVANDPDMRVREEARGTLWAIGLRNRSQRERVVSFFERALPKADAAELIGRIREYEGQPSTAVLTEAQYRDTIAHSDRYLKAWAENRDDSPGIPMNLVLDYVTSDPVRTTACYDLLLQVLARGGNSARTVGLRLARPLAQSADDQAKRQTDRLLDSLEKLGTERDLCFPEVLGQMILPSDWAQSQQAVIRERLSREPIYAKDRIVSDLISCTHDSNPHSAAEAAARLEYAAWVDAATAQEILEGLRPWKTELEGRVDPWKATPAAPGQETAAKAAVLESLGKAIRSAEDALVHYGKQPLSNR